MEVKTEKRVVEQIITAYIAVDGTEFVTERECVKYEKELEFKRSLEQIKPLEYKTDGKRPCDGEENPEHWIYKWYKVNNTDDVEKLKDVYGSHVAYGKVTYPEYINIQQYSEYDLDVGSTTLTNCKEYVTEFFADFGIAVEFKEMEK